jgi:hypothetical protein
MESKFEELENIINDEYVRYKVTDLKNISIDMFDCLIDLFKYDGEIIREEFQLKIIEIIESATGKSIDEVMRNE